MKRNLVLIFALLIIVLGVFVLIGWVFDIQLLKSVLSKSATMKANTAFSMILCGLCIIFLSAQSHSFLLRFTVIVQSLIVITIALVTLLEYLLQLDLGLDQLLFKESQNLINPGRMSPTTAFCFLNTASSILLLVPKRKLFYNIPISAALSTTVIIISGLVLISYIPNVLFGFNMFSYANMSVHTALLFVLLGYSLLYWVILYLCLLKEIVTFTGRSMHPSLVDALSGYYHYWLFHHLITIFLTR